MSVLLALLHAGVARKEASLVQRRPDGLIVASQGPRNPVPDRARLPGVAAPVHQNLSAARQQPHSCHGILAPACSPRYCLNCHRPHLVSRRAPATSSRQTSLVFVQSADAPRRHTPSAAWPTSCPTWFWGACRGPPR